MYVNPDNQDEDLFVKQKFKYDENLILNSLNTFQAHTTLSKSIFIPIIPN